MNFDQNKVAAKMNWIEARRKYAGGRANLLLVTAMSVINLFLIVFTGDYFVFSSFVTQFLASLGVGLYAELSSVIWLVIFGVLSAVSIVPYVLCYLFSQKKGGWMIAALVLFSADTLFLLFFFLISMETTLIFDVLIHIYVIVTLVTSVRYAKRAFAAPAEEAPIEADFIEVVPEGETVAEQNNDINE